MAVKEKSKSTGGGGVGFGASKKPVFVHTPDQSEATQKLYDFLKSQKTRGLNNVEIGTHNGRRGLFAIEKIKKDQLICQIPSDLALAISDPAKKGEDVPTVAHEGLNFLNMYWNNEQARKLWAPYLDMLPTMESTQFDPTPDYYNDEQLQLLEFPRAIQRVQDRQQAIQALSEEKGVSKEELQFATWMVQSRAFPVSISDQDDAIETTYDERGQVVTKGGVLKSIKVLVPIMDMANHDSINPNGSFTLIDPEKDDAWFAIRATRPIAPGKEIVLAYGGGASSTVELLLDYGFVPPENKIDKIMLSKGGDDCFAGLSDWTTTLEEDEAMINMIDSGEVDDPILRKILAFRIQLKKSYN